MEFPKVTNNYLIYQFNDVKKWVNTELVKLDEKNLFMSDQS